MNNQADLILIERVVKGDVSAFNILVNTYKDMALTLAYNILLSDEDAEDITQDAFIKAYSSLHTFKGNSKFATWFYRIVLNTALNKKKKSKLDTVIVSNDLFDETEQDIPAEINTYSNDEQRRFIQLALTALGESERVCITMYYLNELTVDEVSELTGYSPSNIKVLLYRGRKKLYDILSKMLKHEINDLI